MMFRFLMAFLLLAVAVPPTPLLAAQLRVECPEVIGIGLPFVVRVESDEPMGRLLVEWGDRNLQVSAAGDRDVQFLLGSDVLKSKPGPQALRVTRLGLSPVAGSTHVLVETREFPSFELL